MQEDLDALLTWEQKWLMEFNPSKCQVIRITDKRQPIPSTYAIHGHVLEVEVSAKYLGVHLDSKINFNKGSNSRRTQEPGSPKVRAGSHLPQTCENPHRFAWSFQHDFTFQLPIKTLTKIHINNS